MKRQYVAFLDGVSTSLQPKNGLASLPQSLYGPPDQEKKEAQVKNTDRIKKAIEDLGAVRLDIEQLNLNDVSDFIREIQGMLVDEGKQMRKTHRNK